MTTIPKIKTQGEQYREDIEARGIGDVFLHGLIASMTGRYNPLPKYDDVYKIASDSSAEFRRGDYSEAFSYIDSLVKIVEHYQGLAENYREALDGIGASYYESGEVDAVAPFAVINGQEWIAGNAEVFDLSAGQLGGAEEYLKRYWRPYSEKEAERVANALNKHREPVAEPSA